MKTDLARKKILVVDDDLAIRNLIYRFLSQSKQNYHIECAADGATALTVFDRFSPDLVILDVILPDAIGFKLCEEMKSRTGVMVMLLTSLTDVKSQVLGLESADAYVTKPFYVEVLEKQVEAILRRSIPIINNPTEQQPIVLESLVIDPVRREVTLNDRRVTLTALEFDLLHFLASNPGRVWRRKELMREVWKYEHTGAETAEDRVVDVHIGQIRKKIEVGSQPSLIQTVRNVGYRLEIPDRSQALEK